jgi:hypothetical protein
MTLALQQPQMQTRPPMLWGMTLQLHPKTFDLAFSWALPRTVKILCPRLKKTWAHISVTRSSAMVLSPVSDIHKKKLKGFLNKKSEKLKCNIQIDRLQFSKPINARSLLKNSTARTICTS